ncbi:MAG: hypothetical protein NTX50_06780 [Candidatus Sumerlaeota bacterium]|nr:hypothetical protein [Candidatus Sumerlaeota bacterium]
MALSAAAAERITTARERSGWLAVCLGYNPKSGVVPLILRAVAAATLLIVLAFAGFAVFGGRKKVADRAIADDDSAKIDESQM